MHNQEMSSVSTVLFQAVMSLPFFKVIFLLLTGWNMYRLAYTRFIFLRKHNIKIVFIELHLVQYSFINNYLTNWLIGFKQFCR